MSYIRSCSDKLEVYLLVKLLQIKEDTLKERLERKDTKQVNILYVIIYVL